MFLYIGLSNSNDLIGYIHMIPFYQRRLTPLTYIDANLRNMFSFGFMALTRN
jgi:hypothetical protein